MKKYHSIMVIMVAVFPISMLLGGFFKSKSAEIITLEEGGGDHLIPDETGLWTDLDYAGVEEGWKRGGEEELKYKDSAYWILERNNDADSNDIEAIFTYRPKDLESLPETVDPYNKYWDLYHILLYLTIEAEGSGIELNLYYWTIEIGSTSETWKLLTEIDSNTDIDYQCLEIDRALKFRILGTISDPNAEVKIDRFRMIQVHEGILGNEGGHNAYTDPGTVNRESGWSEGNTEQRADIEKTFHYNFPISGGQITDSDTINFNAQASMKAYADFELYGWKDADTKMHKIYFAGSEIWSRDSVSTSHPYDSGWKSHSWSSNIGTGRTYSNDFGASARSHVVIYRQRVKVKIYINPGPEHFYFRGFGFDNFHYPSVSNLRLSVDPGEYPLSNVGDFSPELNAQSNYAGSIDEVNCLLLNNIDKDWNDDNKNDWREMPYSSTQGKYALSVENLYDTNSLPDGPYTFWIKIKDDKEYTTLEKYDFTLQKGNPWTIPLTPGDDEVIDSLYNLEIKVLAFSGYGIQGSVEYRMYNETEDIVKDWTVMNPIEDTEEWNDEINPIDFGNGKYKFEFKVSDSQGTGYSYSYVNFDNKPPDVTFNLPSKLGIIYDVLPIKFNVSVSDVEENPFDNVSLMIYNSTQDPFYSLWQNLTNQESTDNWLYDINPLDFEEEEDYTLKIRVKDHYGFSYNEQSFLFLRPDPILKFDQTSYNIFQMTPKNIFFNITQGVHEISNFTYSITEGLHGYSYLSGFQEAESSITRYQIEINPFHLPYSDESLILTVQALNHSRALFTTFTTLSVDYFIENIEDNYYTFDQSSCLYQSDDVETNNFVRSSYRIDYIPGQELGHNYKFDVPGYIENEIYSKEPDFEIIRTEEPFPYKPISEYSSIDIVAFRFKLKPKGRNDTISFNIQTPTLDTAEDFEDPETGTLDDGREYLSIELILESAFDFTNIKCIFEPFIPVKDAVDYSYSLYFFQAGKWVKSDIEIEYIGDYFEGRWEFLMESIEGGEVIGLKIYGIKTAGADINLAPLMYGGIVAAAVGIVWFALLRKPMLRREVFKKKSWVYYAIGAGLCVGLFTAVFFGTGAMGSLMTTHLF